MLILPIPSSNTKPVCSIWLKNSATYQKPVKSWAFRVRTFYRYREAGRWKAVWMRRLIVVCRARTLKNRKIR